MLNREGYVSAMSNRFNNIIERIQNRQEQPSSSVSLVDRLRMFRQNTPIRGPRRREQTRLASFRVGLLLHPDMETFHPQKSEALRKIKVLVSLSAEELHAVLRNAFPRVGSTDFELAKVDCHKKITRLQVSPLSPSVLKASRELNRSALYILPKESLEEQVGEQQDGCQDAEEVLDSGQSLDQDDEVQVVHTSHNSMERPNTMERDVVRESHDTQIVEVADDVSDDLLEWRALRARQDEEYMQSLQTDQERDQAWSRGDIYNKRKEALERRRLNLSSRTEPQDGIPLQVKYPDGHVIRRRFLLMQPIQHLFDFVGSDDMATEVFSIQQARASPISSTTTGRIIDHITESCTVFVTWNDAMDTDSNDSPLPEEATIPQNISSGSSDTTAGFLDLSHVKDTEPDLRTLLTTLASKVWIGETPSSNMINVCRENIMDGAMRAFARQSFNPEAKLSVIFMDDFMQAEGSVDEGGPTREFFRLLMIALKDSALFTGPQNSKNLSLDSLALHRGLYRTYGVMMAVALVHGGVLPSFFSDRLYQNLCSTPTSPPTLEEVADPDLQWKLKKISEAGDITEARAAIEEAAESLSLLGSLRHITTMEGRDQLVQSATSFYVEGRTKEALQQLSEGLNTLGLLDLMKIHPSIFKEVFSSSERPLKATNLISLFQATLSPPGSNRWRLEKRVEGYWRDFLVDVEDGVFEITMEQILVFASGADRLPALGFSPPRTLNFIHDTGRKYPEANTCLVNLKLPIHDTYRQFTKFMCDGIIQAPTFGLA